MRLLVGDIGGTNTRLAYVQDDCTPSIRQEKTYASSDYASFIDVIEDFLSSYDIQKSFDAVCLAAAEPVLSGCASITNLPWHICEAELAKLLQTQQVSLINDLTAVAYAIPNLQADELLVLQDGENNSGQQANQMLRLLLRGQGWAPRTSFGRRGIIRPLAVRLDMLVSPRKRPSRSSCSPGCINSMPTLASKCSCLALASIRFTSFSEMNWG